MEIAKKSQNDQNDQSDPKTTETTKATKQKILRPDDSENDQFGRKRPKMATLELIEHCFGLLSVLSGSLSWLS